MNNPHPCFEQFSLSGRNALVTGSGYGLGQSIAIALADAGARVMVSGRTATSLDDTCEIIRDRGGSAVSHVFDATDSAQCDELLAQATRQLGSVDIAIINHGIIIVDAPQDTSDKDWQQVIEVNLNSCFYCARAAGRQMIEQGRGGAIVLTSSNGSLVSFDGLSAYGASKGGVDQLCRQLAAAWGPYQIRVNTVNPGYTENPMGGRGDQLFSEQEEQVLAAQTPLGRRGRVEEIAGPVLFLASDAASFITGHCLVVDGGYCAL